MDVWNVGRFWGSSNLTFGNFLNWAIKKLFMQKIFPKKIWIIHKIWDHFAILAIFGIEFSQNYK